MPAPAPPPGRPIASYRNYLEAQRAVDYLSDEKFPVQHVSIVGTDLKMVERVTGRLTYPRVAAAGLFSGAYFGGFVGLLLGLFGGTEQLGVTLLSGILIGAGFGIIFGVISFAATGGRRDFTSTSQIVASEYAVWCADDQAAEATRVLSGLEGGAVRVPVPPAGWPGPASSDASAGAAQAGPVTGPTYSEALAMQKAERQQEADRQQAAEDAAQAQQQGPSQDQQRPEGPSHPA